MIDVEYERIQKKCFRLSHEKQACPLLKGTMKGSAKGEIIRTFQMFRGWPKGNTTLHLRMI